MHALLPEALWYLPGAHLVGVQAACGARNPGETATQEATDTPPSQWSALPSQLRKVPSLQSAHSVAPKVDHCPHLQGRQCAAVLRPV